MFVIGLSRWWQGSSGDSSTDFDRAEGSRSQRSDAEEDYVPPETEAIFQSASNFVQSNVTKIDQQTLLKLYGCYKQSMCGPADPSHRPAIWDPKGRKKFEYWEALGQISKAMAMTRYTDLVASLSLGWDPSVHCASQQGLGLRPSRPKQQSEGDPISDDPQSRTRALWFVACKAGDVDTASCLLREEPSLLETADEHLGLTALQWAIDNGADSVVEWLISKGADVNVTDPEGNTPLHFAAYCGREQAARLLLAAGADRTRPNADGLTPCGAADEETMIDLLR